jgi:TPR repeat protein
MEAMEAMAECYLKGEGVKQNFDKGYEFFCKLQGEDLDLHYCFTLMFKSADRQKVMEWIQPGIDRGDPVFMVGLASCYEAGHIDAEDDEVRAMSEKLYREAAKLGHPIAQINFVDKVMEKFDYACDVPREEQEEAFEYCREGAEGGDQDQQYYLARMYKNGIGTEKNEGEAFRWYRATAEAIAEGEVPWPQAIRALGECYRDGVGVEKNPEEAEKWFAKAEEQDAELERLFAETEDLEAESPDSDD